MTLDLLRGGDNDIHWYQYATQGTAQTGTLCARRLNPFQDDQQIQVAVWVKIPARK
jgi:hypothetical protein